MALGFEMGRDVVQRGFKAFQVVQEVSERFLEFHRGLGSFLESIRKFQKGFMVYHGEILNYMIVNNTDNTF